MSEDLREKSTGRRGLVLSDRRRLLLASFLMLFVELALIRWTAANDIYLAHLTNFVLLASFLGIGIGFLLAGAERDLFPFGPPALAVYWFWLIQGTVGGAPRLRLSSQVRASRAELRTFQTPAP